VATPYRGDVKPARTVLARIALQRVVVPLPSIEDDLPVPWSRGLWGRFLPDRRRGGPCPAQTQPERRVTP
jgi:hypothetical protein